MRKLFALFAMFILLGAAAYCEDLNSILEKSYQAQGGLDKLLAIQSYAMKGKMLIKSANMEFPMEINFKQPGKMKWIINISGQVMIQSFDGNTGWMINPFVDKTKAQAMPEEQLNEMKQMVRMQDVLVRYKQNNVQLKFLREDLWEGTPVFIIEARIDDQHRAEIYLDKESFLEIKEVSFSIKDGQETRAETVLGDYKEVSGVLVPHSLEISSLMQEMTLTFSEIEINKDIADQEFEMPKIEKQE